MAFIGKRMNHTHTHPAMMIHGPVPVLPPAGSVPVPVNHLGSLVRVGVALHLRQGQPIGHQNQGDIDYITYRNAADVIDVDGDEEDELDLFDLGNAGGQRSAHVVDLDSDHNDVHVHVSGGGIVNGDIIMQEVQVWELARALGQLAIQGDVADRRKVIEYGAGLVPPPRPCSDKFVYYRSVDGNDDDDLANPNAGTSSAAHTTETEIDFGSIEDEHDHEDFVMEEGRTWDVRNVLGQLVIQGDIVDEMELDVNGHGTNFVPPSPPSSDFISHRDPGGTVSGNEEEELGNTSAGAPALSHKKHFEFDSSDDEPDQEEFHVFGGQDFVMEEGRTWDVRHTLGHLDIQGHVEEEGMDVGEDEDEVVLIYGTQGVQGAHGIHGPRGDHGLQIHDTLDTDVAEIGAGINNFGPRSGPLFGGDHYFGPAQTSTTSMEAAMEQAPDRVRFEDLQGHAVDFGRTAAMAGADFPFSGIQGNVHGVDAVPSSLRASFVSFGVGTPGLTPDLQQGLTPGYSLQPTPTPAGFNIPLPQAGSSSRPAEELLREIQSIREEAQRCAEDEAAQAELGWGENKEKRRGPRGFVRRR